jgi:regulator of sigma E protease
MLSFLYSVVGFILAIAVLVTVHEFGHYWVARRLGVKVLRFSVGFGKPLWKKVAGEDQIEYVIAAIPLGGYVKMLGEGDDEYTPEESGRAFDNQRLWKRAAIVLAGPMINFLFAAIVYAGLNSYGFEAAKPFLGNIQKESVLYQAGLREGDELLSVDGKKFNYFSEHQLHVFNRALKRDQMLLNISREGQEKEVVVDFSKLTVKSYKPSFLTREIGLQGVQPKALPVIGRIAEGFPAEDSDLKVGDEIVRINDKDVSSWRDIVNIISKADDGLMDLGVKRDGVVKWVSIRPRTIERDGVVIRQVGIAPEIVPVSEDMIFYYRDSFGSGAIRALDQTWQMSALTLRVLGKMITGQASHKNISGPITIASIAGEALQLSWFYYFSILAAISISLGVMNLLPVPMLDGGHLLYYSIEAIKGSPLSEKAMLVGQKIGLLLLACLMSLAFYNDIFRLFS